MRKIKRLLKSAPLAFAVILGSLFAVKVYTGDSPVYEEEGLSLVPSGDNRTTNAAAIDNGYIYLQWHSGMRLGNLMFVYASLLGIASLTGKRPLLDKAFPLYRHFPYLSIEPVEAVQG